LQPASPLYMESHSVTCHPAEMTLPPLPQQSSYSICRPRRDAGLSLHFTTCRCTSLCEMTQWSQLSGVFITPTCKCIQNKALQQVRHQHVESKARTVCSRGHDSVYERH